jgi:hypothetical protein
MPQSLLNLIDAPAAPATASLEHYFGQHTQDPDVLQRARSLRPYVSNVQESRRQHASDELSSQSHLHISAIVRVPGQRECALNIDMTVDGMIASTCSMCSVSPCPHTAAVILAHSDQQLRVMDPGRHENDDPSLLLEEIDHNVHLDHESQPSQRPPAIHRSESKRATAPTQETPPAVHEQLPSSTQGNSRRLPSWLTKGPVKEEPKPQPAKRKAKECSKADGAPEPKRKPVVKKKKEDTSIRQEPEIVVIGDSDESIVAIPADLQHTEQESFTSYQPTRATHAPHRTEPASLKEHPSSLPSSSDDPLVSYFDSLIHAPAVPRKGMRICCYGVDQDFAVDQSALVHRKVSKRTEALLDDLFGTNSSGKSK